MRVLFVGGPRDGEWSDWTGPLRQYVKVDVFRPVGDVLQPHDFIRIEQYRLEYVTVGGSRAPVYVHDKMTDDKALTMLLEGYE